MPKSLSLILFSGLALKKKRIADSGQKPNQFFNKTESKLNKLHWKIKFLITNSQIQEVHFYVQNYLLMDKTHTSRN